MNFLNLLWHCCRCTSFFVLFVGSGTLWLNQSQGVDFAFYQISAPVAILPAIALAIFIR